MLRVDPEEYLMNLWLALPLATRARLMMIYPEGLDPLIAALRDCPPPPAADKDPGRRNARENPDDGIAQTLQTQCVQVYPKTHEPIHVIRTGSVKAGHQYRCSLRAGHDRAHLHVATGIVWRTMPTADAGREWFIYDARTGQFWGPNCGGYFGLWGAGLYTEAEARRISGNKCQTRSDRMHHITEYRDQIANMRGSYERLNAALQLAERNSRG